MELVAISWVILATVPVLLADLGPGIAHVLTFGLCTVLAIRGRRPWPCARATLMSAAGLATGWTLLPGLAAVVLWVGDGLGLPGPWPRGVGHGPGLLAATVVLAPLFEEIIYRDRLLPALVVRVGRGPALLFSSAAFALPHATAWAILGSLIAGLVLGSARLAGRNNLGLCVGIHAGLNLRLACLPTAMGAMGALVMTAPH